MSLKSILINLSILFLLINCNYSTKHYYKNGNLKSVERIIDGKKNGEAIYYDSLGNIEVKGNFKNDLQDGVFERYINNKLMSKYNYKEGKLEGECYDYQENGQLVLYTLIENNHEIFSRGYDSLGNIKVEMNIKNGKANGPFKAYEDGKIYATGTYVDDKVVGIVTYYDENGKVVEEAPAK